MIKKVLLTIVLLLLAIQFFRPKKNVSNQISSDAIEKHYVIPEKTGILLKRSCYDCHSNHTAYPWYSNIQPFAWWLQNHVDEGKRELNFDEFNSYTVKKKKHKLDEVAEMMENNEMPLKSYTLVHKNAVLSSEEKDEIIAWAKALKEMIK